MLKLADCIPAGQTALVVNPTTTRVYGAFHANDGVVVADPNTVVVYVDEPLEVVTQWLADGIFYRDGAIYRRMNVEPMRAVGFAGKEVEYTLTFPEVPLTELQVRVINSTGVPVVEFGVEVTKQTEKVTIPLPDSPGVYTVRFESEEYGRISTALFVQKLIKHESLPAELEVSAPRVNLAGVEAMTQSEIGKLLGQSLRGTSFGENMERARRQLEERTAELSEREKKGLLSAFLEKLKRLFGGV